MNDVTVAGSMDMEPYNHNENVAAIKQYVEEVRRMNAEYAVKIGQRLIMMKDNIDHGRWLETIEEIGFGIADAQRLMKIARTFGDDPTLLEGMTKRKAYLLSTLPEENLIQLKQDKVLTDFAGNVYTMGEIQDMTIRQLENKYINQVNQKRKESAEWRDRAQTAEAEIEAARQQIQEAEDTLWKMRENYSETHAAEKRLTDKRIADQKAEIDRLKKELDTLEERTVGSHEAIAIFEKAESAIWNAISAMNRLGKAAEPTGNNEAVAKFDKLASFAVTIRRHVKHTDFNRIYPHEL